MKVRFRATEVTEYEFDTGDVSPGFIKQVLDAGQGFGPGDFHLQDFGRGNLISYAMEYVEVPPAAQLELDFTDQVANEIVKMKKGKKCRRKNHNQNCCLPA
jgi:hypothetical protein